MSLDVVPTTDTQPGFINVTSYGATGDGSTDDTVAIQAAFDVATTGSIVYVPKAQSGQFYKLTDTLTIPDVRGIRIIGESKETSELRMTTNNRPIIQTSGQYQRSLSFEELRLSYTTQQTNASHPNSYAVAFSGPTATHVYYSLCRRLHIDKATVGIGVLQGAGETLQVWANTFEEIDMASVSHTLIKTDPTPGDPAGNPPNKISRIAHIDEYAAADPTGPAFLLFGRNQLITLDVEDWKGRLITWGSGSGTCDGLYTERYSIGDLETAIACDSGNYLFRDVTFSGTMASSSTVTLFALDIGHMKIEGTEIGLDFPGTSVLVHHITGAASNTRLEVEYPRVTVTGGADPLTYFMYPGSTNTVQATRVIGSGQAATMGSVASAATVTLPDYGDTITITGTTTITSITASWADRRVTLILSSTAQLTDGSNLKLASNYTGAANRTITLVCDGTDWYEVGRSAN